MKKQITLIIITFITLVFTVNAGTLLNDNFTVTGGGDINYQYNTAGRQTGTLAPLQYIQFLTAGTFTLVTNAGPTAGKVNVNSGGSDVVLSPDYDFTNEESISVEVEIERLTVNGWTSLAIGKDGPSAAPWSENGFTVMFYPGGDYYVYDNWNSGTPIAHFTFPELAWTVNPILKVRLVASQPGGYPPTGDMQIALFINDKAYPLNGDHVEYTHTHTGGFADNFINIYTYNDLNIDNWKFLTPPGNLIETSSWTDDGNSEITNVKTYTHAVCFVTNDDVTVNGVTFTGTGTATSGSNWELKFADAVVPTPYNIFADWGVDPGVSGDGRGFLQDVLYDWTSAGAIDLTGLTPGQQYILTLYSCGVGGTVSRDCYFATSDGAPITIKNQMEFGIAPGSPGQLLKYQYTASADIFSISATPTNFNNANWGWFAFSNEEAIPEPTMLIGFICLTGMILSIFGRKK